MRKQFTKAHRYVRPGRNGSLVIGTADACLRRTALLLFYSFVVQAQNAPKIQNGPLRDFYIIADVVSDASPFAWTYILDAATNDGQTLVQWVRIAPLDEFCKNTLTIKSAEVRLNELPLRKLATTVDLCRIDLETVKRTLGSYARQAPARDDVSFAIVAHCGETELRLYLPFESYLDFERLKRDEPQIAALWDLYQSIVQTSFDEQSVFWDLTDKEDLARQRDGARLIPVLKSGRYDAGFQLPCEHPLIQCETGWSYLHELLARYPGPVPPRRDSKAPAIRLVSPAREMILHYREPEFTDEMLSEGVRGSAELRVNVEPSTDSVVSVRSASGSPTLLRAVTTDLSEWRFEQGTPGLSTGVVNLIFVVDNACP